MQAQPKTLDSVTVVFRVLAAWLVVAGFIGAIGTLLYQTAIWLKTGIWSAWTYADGLMYVGVKSPKLSWVGAQKILHWILALPVSEGVLISGLALAALAWVVGS